MLGEFLLIRICDDSKLFDINSYFIELVLCKPFYFISLYKVHVLICKVVY